MTKQYIACIRLSPPPTPANFSYERRDEAIKPMSRARGCYARAHQVRTTLAPKCLCKVQERWSPQDEVIILKNDPESL